jgi:hypothetical protein
MTKQEILKLLYDSGEWHRHKNTKLWRDAFDFYMSETMQPVSTTCGRCYDKVKKWLKQ